MSAPEPAVVGWDIGGAHVKAALVEHGRLVDVAQWPCPLWQGLQHLDAALAQARRRWPQAWQEQARHAATMTGEMVDLFADRQDGVRRLGAHLAEAVGPSLHLYAGERGFVPAHAAGEQAEAIASANWRATAELVAVELQEAVLVDIGSTTTDLIPLRAGRVAARGANDAQRLARGELVYQGVVRTPLCALGPRVPFGPEQVNLMNEFFATSADVYRLTGELDAAHDQHPSADGGPKTAAASRQRMARMIGRDARDADEAQWLALARHWREAQLTEISGQLQRALRDSGLADDAPLVGAGCGDFLARELAHRHGRPYRSYARDVLRLDDASLGREALRWAGVCAPAVAVALLNRVA